MDVAANMARRMLVAAQPLLEDMGAHEGHFGRANEAFQRYDQVKNTLSHVDDAYSRMADAVD